MVMMLLQVQQQLAGDLQNQVTAPGNLALIAARLKDIESAIWVIGAMIFLAIVFSSCVRK